MLYPVHEKKNIGAEKDANFAVGILFACVLIPASPFSIGLPLALHLPAALLPGTDDRPDHLPFQVCAEFAYHQLPAPAFSRRAGRCFAWLYGCTKTSLVLILTTRWRRRLAIVR